MAITIGARREEFLAENPKRHILDELLKRDFQLTKKDVEEKIQELESDAANCKDANWKKMKLESLIDARRKEMEQLMQDEKTGTTRLLRLVTSEIGEENQLKALLEKGYQIDSKEIFDESQRIYRKRMAVSVDKEAQDICDLHQFAQKGAEGILEEWQKVISRIKEMSESNDDEVRAKIKEEHPEFCDNIANYLFFARGTDWHELVENLILQKIKEWRRFRE